MFVDSHVHFRDFNQKDNTGETVKHGLEVAYDSGLDAVFDMPNTSPPIVNRELVLERLKLARESGVKDVFYGLYIGLTKDPEQVKNAVEIYREFKEVVGLKLYAGHSVGTLAVVEEEDQRKIYEVLKEEGYDGVLVVHCEKEKYIDSKKWDPSTPITHCYARPEIAEIESVKDQLRFSKEVGFKGKLHIAHVSSPKSVDLAINAKEEGLDVSLGVCPHHFIYDWTQMNEENGILWKMNPPLRAPESKEKLFQYLKEGKIDWIETDHAPHTLKRKIDRPYMSGIPGIAWWPLFYQYLLANGFTETQIEKLTFSNIVERFELNIQRTRRDIKDRRKDYEFDPYEKLAKELGWKG